MGVNVSSEYHCDSKVSIQCAHFCANYPFKTMAYPTWVGGACLVGGTPTHIEAGFGERWRLWCTVGVA